MKKALKRRLITLAILIPTVVVIVEFEKWIKHRAHDCEDGQCARPRGYGLVIDPFPEEFVPKNVNTNQLNEGSENE